MAVTHARAMVSWVRKTSRYDLEVVALDPIELAPAPEEEEDWGE